MRDPLLLGLVLALLTVLAGLLLGSAIDQLAKPSDPSAIGRFGALSTIVAAMTGLAAGRVLGRTLPRYRRTPLHSARLVNDGLVAIGIALPCALALSYLLALQAVPALSANPVQSLAALLIAGVAAAWLSSPEEPNKSNHLPKKRASTWTLNDRPVRHIEEDELHREGVVSVLEGILAEQRASRDGLVVAIDGPWGAGKTSVMNFLEERLRSHGNDYLVVRFDPWNYDDPPALLAAFFADLSEQVSRRYLLPDLEFQAGRYVAALAPTLSRFGFSLDPLRRRSVDVLKGALERLTEGLPAHLVVILDDIDRLQKPELLATLRLMKLSASLPNITYIAGIHVQPVVEFVLNDQLPGYLDKFIDQVIPLSVLDSRLRR